MSARSAGLPVIGVALGGNVNTLYVPPSMDGATLMEVMSAIFRPGYGLFSDPDGDGCATLTFPTLLYAGFARVVSLEAAFPLRLR